MDDRSDPSDEHTGEATVVEEDDLALEAYLEEGRLRRDALQALPYTEYLTTDHWRCTRERALRRAWRRCQMCNADADLHVHHNTYERRGREADRRPRCALLSLSRGSPRTDATTHALAELRERLGP
ncbi:MAG: hypothetical protein M5T61_18590 [Acidimicrobiia bacterium]|nr:hypothetical protein [Acidimicrobiia bacterium]